MVEREILKEKEEEVTGITPRQLDYLMIKAREDFADELSCRYADMRSEMRYAPPLRKAYLDYKSSLYLTTISALRQTNSEYEKGNASR